MNNPEQDIELIEGYLLETISNDERLVVEAKLKTDGEFAKLFNELKIIIGGVQQATRNEILDQLKNVEAGLKKIELVESDDSKIVPISRESKKESRKLWAPLSIAASLILLIGIVWFNNLLGPKANSHLAAYYEPLPSDLVYMFKRDTFLTELTIKQQAAKLLEAEDYENALTMLDKLVFEKKDTSENIIRVYTNTLLQNKSCKTAHSKIEQLKDHLHSSAHMSIIIMDQILLHKKCKFDKIENISIPSLVKEIDEESLTDWDQKKWLNIKETL